MLFNLIAVVLSVLALASSTALALQQGTLQRKANVIPAYVDLLSEFRSLSFNDNYRFVTETLPTEHDPQLGISELPDDARAAVYDIAYFFQTLAGMRLFGIVDDEVLVVLRMRIVEVWDSIAPFVERERELHGTTGIYLLRVLEGFAADARELPSGSVNTLLRYSRRSPWLRRRALRRSTAKALGATSSTITASEAED